MMDTRCGVVEPSRGRLVVKLGKGTAEAKWSNEVVVTAQLQ